MMNSVGNGVRKCLELVFFEYWQADVNALNLNYAL
jgi:hypothetical protein